MYSDVIELERILYYWPFMGGGGGHYVTVGFPSPVMRSFDVFFDVSLSKWLRNNREKGELRCIDAHFILL